MAVSWLHRTYRFTWARLLLLLCLWCALLLLVLTLIVLETSSPAPTEPRRTRPPLASPRT